VINEEHALALPVHNHLDATRRRLRVEFYVDVASSSADHVVAIIVVQGSGEMNRVQPFLSIFSVTPLESGGRRPTASCMS